MKRVLTIISGIFIFMVLGWAVSYAGEVQDPGFEDPDNSVMYLQKNSKVTTDLIFSNSPGKWFLEESGGNNTQWEWDPAGGNPTGNLAFDPDSNGRAKFFGAFIDNKETTGVRTLPFDYYHPEDAKNPQDYLAVAVWGLNQEDTDFSINLGASKPMDTDAVPYLLGYEMFPPDLTTSYVTETSLSFDVGAEGYDALVIGFAGSKMKGNTGEESFFRVDNLGMSFGSAGHGPDVLYVQ